MQSKQRHLNDINVCASQLELNFTLGPLWYKIIYIQKSLTVSRNV